MIHNVIILGSGCAGSTAAIYTARANLGPLVFEGKEPGGQLSITTDVENYPGFPEGVQGPDLVELMKKQAQRFGAEYRYEQVEKVDFSKSPFSLQTDKEAYQAKTVIIAAGASAKLLGLDSERALIGYGVSTCATCDGPLFRGKEVAVIGGGDTAMEEALFLTRFTEKVYVIHRRAELRASKIMADRALASDKIEFLWNTVIDEFEGAPEKSLTGLRLRNRETGDTSTLAVEGAFVAIGHHPNTDFLDGQLETNEVGYLIVSDGSKTSVDGVFAAGDVHDHVYRQAITAAGAGCKAAIDAERWLESQDA